MITMPSKGNKNAALKPGEIGRVHWTQSLSGDLLTRFLSYHQIDASELSERELRDRVAPLARAMFEEMVSKLERKSEGG